MTDRACWAFEALAWSLFAAHAVDGARAERERVYGSR